MRNTYTKVAGAFSALWTGLLVLIRGARNEQKKNTSDAVKADGSAEWKKTMVRVKTCMTKHPHAVKAAAVLAVMIAFVGPASADTAITSMINFTDLGLLFDGLAGLMPHVMLLIASIVGIVVVVAIIRFVPGILDTLLNGINKSFTFGRR